MKNDTIWNLVRHSIFSITWSRTGREDFVHLLDQLQHLLTRPCTTSTTQRRNDQQPHQNYNLTLVLSYKPRSKTTLFF
jgi:hypothetical protein